MSFEKKITRIILRMDLSTFKAQTKELALLEKRLKDINAESKTLRTKKKKLMDDVMKFMVDKNVKRVASGGFEIQLAKSERVPALNINTMKQAWGKSVDVDSLFNILTSFRKSNKVVSNRLKFTKQS